MEQFRDISPFLNSSITIPTWPYSYYFIGISQIIDMLGEEVFFEHNNSSPEDEEFDTIVGALEEILQDDGFQGLLNAFYTDNCGARRCLPCQIAQA